MRAGLLSTSVLLLLAGCEEKKTQPEPAPASAAPTPAAAASGAASHDAGAAVAAKEAAPAGSIPFAVAMGKSSFLIDAPLEKIKGMTDEVRGQVHVVPKNLAASRGEIMVRVSTLKTSTFGEMEKDAAQTEHARNWMEVGLESAAESRMKYEWATLSLTSVDAKPASLAEAQEEGGARTVKATVSGDFKLHGITSKKSVPVTVTFKGPADAPSDIVIKTDTPMAVSLKEHDVKPRDKVGSFLNGALDRIGKKIDDKVQVTFEATGKATMPAHP